MKQIHKILRNKLLIPLNESDDVFLEDIKRRVKKVVLYS